MSTPIIPNRLFISLPPFLSSKRDTEQTPDQEQGKNLVHNHLSLIECRHFATFLLATGLPRLYEFFLPWHDLPFSKCFRSLQCYNLWLISSSRHPFSSVTYDSFTNFRLLQQATENRINTKIYSMAPRVIAYEKPKLMANAIARLEPSTDPIPLTAHILGT